MRRYFQLLDWNPFDANEVKPQYLVGNGRVDYSLRSGQKNLVFVEVKSVGMPLFNHQEQLLQYSFGEGVSLAILTDGLIWWFYLPLKSELWNERRFLEIDIRQMDMNEAHDYFVGFLSKQNIIMGKALKDAEKHYYEAKRKKKLRENLPKAWQMMIEDPDYLSILVDLVNECMMKITGDTLDDYYILDYLSQYNKIEYKKENITVPTRDNMTISKPISVKQDRKRIISFKFQGTTYPIKSWKELITRILQLMLEMHPTNFEDKLLVNFPYSGNLFSLENKNFRDPRKLTGTNIFYETHFNRNSIISISERIVKQFGYKKSDLIINYHD